MFQELATVLRVEPDIRKLVSVIVNKRLLMSISNRIQVTKFKLSVKLVTRVKNIEVVKVSDKDYRSQVESASVQQRMNADEIQIIHEMKKIT